MASLDRPREADTEQITDARPDGASWLRFTWVGGVPICEADNPADALVAVKAAALRRLGA